MCVNIKSPGNTSKSPSGQAVWPVTTTVVPNGCLNSFLRDISEMKSEAEGEHHGPLGAALQITRCVPHLKPAYETKAPEEAKRPSSQKDWGSVQGLGENSLPRTTFHWTLECKPPW